MRQAFRRTYRDVCTPSRTADQPTVLLPECAAAPTCGIGAHSTNRGTRQEGEGGSVGDGSALPREGSMLNPVYIRSNL